MVGTFKKTASFIPVCICQSFITQLILLTYKVFAIHKYGYERLVRGKERSYRCIG